MTMAPAMKEAELLEHAVCDFCSQKIGHAGLPLFWRLRVDRYGINLTALEQQSGLAMMLRNTVLARAMGPDADMAAPVMETVTLTACEPCAMTHGNACMVALAKAEATG